MHIFTRHQQRTALLAGGQCANVLYLTTHCIPALGMPTPTQAPPFSSLHPTHPHRLTAMRGRVTSPALTRS